MSEILDTTQPMEYFLSLEHIQLAYDATTYSFMHGFGPRFFLFFPFYDDLNNTALSQHRLQVSAN
jgi:hypothetical protein